MRSMSMKSWCRTVALSASALVPVLGGTPAWAQPIPAPAETPLPSGAPTNAPPVLEAAPPFPPAPPATPDAVPAMPMPPPTPILELPPATLMPPPAVPKPPVPRELVGGKYTTDIYGFVEFDSILDSTQSLNEIAGNTIIAKSGSLVGDRNRITYGARNSRLGFRFKGPDADDLKVSGMLEMDFLGNQPPTVSEASLFNNATFRIRHALLRLETPFVDVWAGQTWQLFGWQGYFFPNSVEIMGLPGQVFSRAPQFRLSHAFKTNMVTFELALASARSPQRDGGVPDTQAGARFLINEWKALHTANSTGTSIDAGGIGVSGVYRRFHVAEFVDTPKDTRGKNAGGISIDALLPLISPSAGHRENALTLTGTYVRGTGIADLYTGLTGGIAYPALASGKAYAPNIDGGLVTYGPGGDLHSIDWQSFMVGGQYYLPPSGSVFVSGNYSQLDSPNIDKYSATALKRSQFWDVNLFWDVNKAVRLGAEFAWFKQKFVDKSTSKNYRGQFSAFYLF